MKNPLGQIRSRLDGLNKAERKATEVILQNPQQATRFSIATLAQVAAVSESTVNRFCRFFNMSGYSELKIQLVQNPASSAAFMTQAVAEDDRPKAYTREIFSNTIASPDNAHKLLDPCVIDRTMGLLTQVRQIYFFGLDASVSVTLDARHKLSRFSLATDAQTDVLMQRMIASMTHTDDLFVVISYTEHTRELIGVARLARRNDAPMLGLAAADSSLVRISTLYLDIPLPEDTDTYTPMTSRIVQLTVLNVLTVGMTLRHGTDFQPYLRRIREGLVLTRHPLDEDN